MSNPKNKKIEIEIEIEMRLSKKKVTFNDPSTMPSSPQLVLETPLSSVRSENLWLVHVEEDRLAHASLVLRFAARLRVLLGLLAFGFSVVSKRCAAEKSSILGSRCCNLRTPVIRFADSLFDFDVSWFVVAHDPLAVDGSVLPIKHSTVYYMIINC